MSLSFARCVGAGRFGYSWFAAMLFACVSAVPLSTALPPKTNGSCGSANGRAYSSAPSSGFCNSGTASTVTLNGANWSWICAGANGGSTSACQAPIAPPAGACGSATQATSFSRPSSNLCSRGRASAVTSSPSAWTWTCSDDPVGATTPCQVARPRVDGECGWADGTSAAGIPTAGTCSAGAMSALRGSGPWSWTCAGTAEGRTARCGANLTTRVFDPEAAGYKRVFDDEFGSFNGTPTGNSGWMTRYNYNGPRARTLPPDEAQFYSDSSVGENPFSLSDGVLDITAAPGSNPQNLPYNSGVITTYQSFWMRYGYFEMRAKLPRGRGLWPAFWLVNENMTWPPEIDAVEMLGHDPTRIYLSTHYKVNGKHVSHTEAFTVADTSADFHTYAVDWGPLNIVYYFDGKPVASYVTPPDMTSPMYMVLCLAVGGRKSWPGAPDSTTLFPAHMYIDYIRAWASPDTTVIGGSLASTGGTSQ
jgi:beta-glucanase (GH16 family)